LKSTTTLTFENLHKISTLSRMTHHGHTEYLHVLCCSVCCRVRNTLQHTATHNTARRMSARAVLQCVLQCVLQSVLQSALHTAAHCNTRRSTSNVFNATQHAFSKVRLLPNLHSKTTTPLTFENFCQSQHSSMYDAAHRMSLRACNAARPPSRR